MSNMRVGRSDVADKSHCTDNYCTTPPLDLLELVQRSHRRGKTFPVANFIHFSVGTQRGGKHALQHAPRTAISQRKLEANFEVETCNSHEDGIWHRSRENQCVLM